MEKLMAKGQFSNKQKRHLLERVLKYKYRNGAGQFSQHSIYWLISDKLKKNNS